MAINNVLLLPSHSHTSIEMAAINPANRFGVKQIGLFDQAVFDCRQLKFPAFRCLDSGYPLQRLNRGTAVEERAEFARFGL